MEILLEQLTHDNYMDALSINRDDIPEEWVDNASYLMGVPDYGAEHHLMGHTFLCRVNDVLPDQRIILEPRVLTTPFEVSANTLKMMDSAVENMKKGKVSPALDLSEFED